MSRPRRCWLTMVFLLLAVLFSLGQVAIAGEDFNDYEQFANVEHFPGSSDIDINPSIATMKCNPAKEDPYSYDPVIAYFRKDLPLGTLYTMGDFNGDGRTDFIVTTNSGSYWWISTGLNNNYVPQCDYYRTDLSLGKVRFVAGDFSGDGKTDLIIITNSGSEWYISKADGFKYKPDILYSDSDLTLGKVSFYIGNFNGDTKTDLLAITSKGSFWYYSEGDTSSYLPRSVYTREDLVLGKVAYAIGNFAGDARSDLVITTEKGSEWYLTTGDLEKYLPVFKFFQTDLSLGKVKFTVVNFAGDNRHDLIITNASGSTWYVSTGQKDNYDPISVYFRDDLLLGKVAYFTWTNFSGDTKGDLVITTAAGSEWYVSNGQGNQYIPIVAYKDIKLTLNNVWYYVANYGGDHHTDVVVVTKEGSSWYITTLGKK